MSHRVAFSLTALALVSWGLWYLGIQQFACSWTDPSVRCEVAPPQDLATSDFRLLFAFPAAFCTALLLLSIILWVRARRLGENNTR